MTMAAKIFVAKDVLVRYLVPLPDSRGCSSLANRALQSALVLFAFGLLAA